MSDVRFGWPWPPLLYISEAIQVPTAYRTTPFNTHSRQKYLVMAITSFVTIVLCAAQYTNDFGRWPGLPVFMSSSDFKRVVVISIAPQSVLNKAKRRLRTDRIDDLFSDRLHSFSPPSLRRAVFVQFHAQLQSDSFDVRISPVMGWAYFLPKRDTYHPGHSEPL